MRKSFLAIIVILYSLNSFGQITFDKGYFINNTNQKVDCFIRNIDWKNNPTEIEYKLTEDSEKKILSVINCKEFGVYNASKYIRAVVKIDRSSENTSDLREQKQPVFNEETLFLKVLIEGKANLYEFRNRNLKRFFFNKENTSITQLIFKKYLISGNKIGKNESYRAQLWENLKCNSINIKTLEKTGYNKKNLSQFFETYNQCENAEFTKYEIQEKRDFFNLNIRPGIRHSSLSINNFTTTASEFSIDFGSNTTARFGIEAEFVMPFNRNKWAFFAEPTYQSFNSTFNLISGRKVDAKYTSIELPFGIRHYLFLSKRSKLFLNGAAVFDFPIGNSAITYENGRVLDIVSEVNFAYGIGFTYKNKYSIELRNQTIRNVLGTFPSWNSKYSSVSLILGYSIL
ncbi:tRNA modification GTPase [Aquimarina sp. SS2-1]|uniref:tRNA modification GTPase n=1 Tax=Aquimarina besae TaxID=3342247 RepID=UPI00366D65B9